MINAYEYKGLRTGGRWTLPYPGLMLGLLQSNERRYYKITPSLIGWTQEGAERYRTQGWC